MRVSASGPKDRDKHLSTKSYQRIRGEKQEGGLKPGSSLVLSAGAGEERCLGGTWGTLFNSAHVLHWWSTCPESSKVTQ